MNEVTVTQEKQLPDKLEDLARFVLIGRERLTAVRASIRAIERVGLAKEVHAQKLLEAQELAEAVLDAEVKIGELTAQIEKANNQYDACDSGVTSTKESKLEELGINRKQSSRYEKIAKHPKAVESAKRIAREEGRVVSRQDVFNLIVEPTVRKASPEAEARQIDRDHMGFLIEKRLNPVVDIASAQRDKANAEDMPISVLRRFIELTGMTDEEIVRVVRGGRG